MTRIFSQSINVIRFVNQCCIDLNPKLAVAQAIMAKLW